MITETDINAIAARVETVLRDIAVPKPSRASEYYAGLTYSIVLLRERVAEIHRTVDNAAARQDSLNIILDEIETLRQKRSELEEIFETGQAVCPTCGATSSNAISHNEMDDIERLHPPPIGAS